MDAIHEYNRRHARRIRRDAVVSIEAVFSIPASRDDISAEAFFDQCLVWLKKEFDQTTVISADVHLDESNPHMHVLLCCVSPNALTGSKSVSFAKYFIERNLRFFEEVGKPHGLEAPSCALSKSDLKNLAHRVKLTIQKQSDPMLRSRCFVSICKAIVANPVNFAIDLGIQIVPGSKPAKKMRTSTQIFTSKGKGRNYDTGEIFPV
jgi:hypothetical protein